MKVVSYGSNRWRIKSGWWVFSWWVTFAGTDIPVDFENKENAEAWLKAMVLWEGRRSDY